MKRIILVLSFVFSGVFSYSQTNSIVTEYYLSNHFTPKSGITPGSNNTLAIDCNLITPRYYCFIQNDIANRLPSQNQVLPIFRITYWFYGGQGFTVPFPDSKLLLLTIWASSTRTGGSPTIGGTSLTKIGQQGNTELWYYQAPFSGSISIQVPNDGGAEIRSTGAAFIHDGIASMYSSSTNSGTNSITSTLVAYPEKENLIFRSNGFLGSGVSSISDISHPASETYVWGLTFGNPTKGCASFYTNLYYSPTSTYSTYTTLTSGTATIDEVSATFYVY